MSRHNVFEAVMLSSTELMESCVNVQRKIPGDVWHFPKETRRKEREKEKKDCRKVRRMERREN